MVSIYPTVFSNEEIHYLNMHNNVIEAKTSLDLKPSGIVYFSVPVNKSICDTLFSRFGLSISENYQIPMRWIKGDIGPHKDSGLSNFLNTYLIYLNNSPGEFIVDSQSYPIQSNTGFVFNEGLLHHTQNTENVPRLLLGPMNELLESVGIATLIAYYTNYEDAYAAGNGSEITPLAYQGNTWILGDSQYFNEGGSIGSYTAWRIAYVYDNPTPPTGVYLNGVDLSQLGLGNYTYYVYATTPCFLEGSNILCNVDEVETYIPVEELKNGTLVKTSLDGYKPVVLIGKGTIQNPGDNERTENRLYKCSVSKYPQLKDDLYITGCHSILEFPITEKQKEDTIKHLGKLFVTDNKYRLMACLDERAEPWNSKGTYTIWHFALDHPNEKMNYGVYANGLLVETCSIYFLKNKSNMTLK
jgi:hypothetical protein